MSTLKTTNIQHPSAGSPAVELTAAGGLWLGGGKILQVVRATPTGGTFSTTSTSFTDVSGFSVSITPQKNTSVVLIYLSAYLDLPTNSYMKLQITDASNNAISGAQTMAFGGASHSGTVVWVSGIGYATPATTSSVTYKTRFKVNAGTGQIDNTSATAQLIAIEVSA